PLTPPALHSFPTRRSSDLDAVASHIRWDTGIRQQGDGPFGELRRVIPETLEDVPGEYTGLCLRRPFVRPEHRQQVDDLLAADLADRKSTRLNSSHRTISYA